MLYSEEERESLFSSVIKDIEENNMSLRKALKGRIDSTTFYNWCDKYENYSVRYARACDTRQETLFDEIIDIADESTFDKKINDKGQEYIDNEAIQRSKLRVDARKWALSKMNPSKYGDKQEIDHTTKGDKMQTIVNLGNGVNPENETTS